MSTSFFLGLVILVSSINSLLISGSFSNLNFFVFLSIKINGVLNSTLLKSFSYASKHKSILFFFCFFLSVINFANPPFVKYIVLSAKFLIHSLVISLF